MTFEVLYETFKQQVYNLALHYAGNTSDAAEITQDVFVAVYHNLGRFRKDAGAGTWIYRITINKSLDYLKARKRKKRFAFLVSLSDSPEAEIRQTQTTFDHPGVALEQREATAHLFALINKLPDNQRTALILTKIEHKSQAEAADIMNLSPKAVESLVQRAKTFLSQKLNLTEG
ncbi:MAG: RNA polymerase sigma factor [Bacteroidia bacterium]|nr:RNA polymerase sigma factor [Bacteroidia bacterium]